MTTSQSTFKGANVKHTKGHPAFVTDDQLRNASIHQVFEWVRSGIWRKKDFERWCSVLQIPLD